MNLTGNMNKCSFAVILFAFWPILVSAKSVNNHKNVRIYLLNKPQCTEKTQLKIENIIARIIAIGKLGRPFPENLDELKLFCKDTTRMVSQVESFFKDCYQKEVRDLANLLIYSVKNNLRKFCTGKKRTKVIGDLIKVAPCANKYIRVQVPCLEQFINQTKPVVYIAQDELKIPHACCNYVEAMKCATQFIDNVRCIRNSKDVILDFIRGLISGVTDLMCNEYNDQTDKCNQLPLPKPKQKNKRNYSTFAFVLIDMLESINDFPGI